ncbi:TetR/AcrR family transcriptional regulator [Clavibacter tessellarius]|uniref:TetR/AcrR family transcriptional regulator n=1 Tax=Clavibacter tessellarius TaxID=31965 RepID=UPI0032455858
MAGAEGPRRYAKGAARRRDILEAALALIAEQGYSASSLQEIADAVGISKAGVLHYFDSREALIAAVLEERDAHSAADHREAVPDADPSDMVGMLLHASSRNAETPGLVALYSRLVVDAAGAEHPAHAYIAGRYARVVGAVADQVRALDVALPDGMDPEGSPGSRSPSATGCSCSGATGRTSTCGTRSSGPSARSAAGRCRCRSRIRPRRPPERGGRSARPLRGGLRGADPDDPDAERPAPQSRPVAFSRM